MNKIKIYSTPNVEGCPIEEYFGIVSANQVAGTGFLTDFVASFSDFFGGNSGAYRSQMNNLYDEVSDALCQKAMNLGANAIICARIDYDNISAKNMSMFMVSMQGTAVKLKEVEQRCKTIEAGLVTEDSLRCAINLKNYSHQLSRSINLSEEQWKYILSHDMKELSQQLYNNYVQNMQDTIGRSELAIQNFPLFLSKLSYQDAVNLVYNAQNINKELIKNLYLFNAVKVLDLAKNPETRNLAIGLLEYDKQFYSQEDLVDMKAIVKYFDNMPDTGKIEEVKGGLFSSGGRKFICECGTKNDEELEYCGNCGKNIKGLTSFQLQQINDFKLKVNTLEEIFTKNNTSMS